MVNKSNKRIESISSEIIRNLWKDHCRNLKKKKKKNRQCQFTVTLGGFAIGHCEQSYFC